MSLCYKKSSRNLQYIFIFHYTMLIMYFLNYWSADKIHIIRNCSKYIIVFFNDLSAVLFDVRITLFCGCMMIVTSKHIVVNQEKRIYPIILYYL